MPLTTARNSRLRFAQNVIVDGVEYWDRVTYPDIVVRQDDTYYIVKPYDTLASIADKAYGDPVLQWVLAIANDMDVWPTDLIPESVLRVPSKSYVRDKLFNGALR